MSQEAFNAINWPLFEYLLKLMQKISDRNGAQFLFYSHPALQEVWNPHIKNIKHSFNLKEGRYDRYASENKLSMIAQRDHILFIPLIDWFLEHGSQGPFHLLPRGPHCNQNGYRLIAKKLSDPCMQLILQHRASDH